MNIINSFSPHPIEDFPPYIDTHYQMLQCLSYTSVSKTYLLQDIATHEKTILKIISDKDYSMRRYRSLSHFKDTHICTPFHHIHYKKHHFMLFPYLIPLKQYIYNHPISLSQLIELFLPLCEALSKLIQHNFHDIDIHPGNLFITDSDQLCLGDFHCTSHRFSQQTLRYQAPELLASPHRRLHSSEQDHAVQYTLCRLLQTLLMTDKDHYDQLPDSLSALIRQGTTDNPAARYSSLKKLHDTLSCLLSDPLIISSPFLFQLHQDSIKLFEEPTISLEQDDSISNSSSYSSIFRYFPFFIAGLLLCGCIMLFSVYRYTHTSLKNVDDFTESCLSSFMPSASPSISPSISPSVSPNISSGVSLSVSHSISPVTSSSVSPDVYPTTSPVVISPLPSQPPQIQDIEWNLQHHSLSKLPATIRNNTLSAEKKKTTVLYIGYNHLSDLSNISHLSHLKELYVHNNRLSHFSDIQSINSLSVLVASHNNITDISHLKHLTNLTFLDLSSNPQLHDITSLSSIKSLTTINLTGTACTSRAIKILQKHLPQCTILF